MDFAERKCRTGPHLCWILQSASQAYDEGSITFTRSRKTATSSVSPPPYSSVAIVQVDIPSLACIAGLLSHDDKQTLVRAMFQHSMLVCPFSQGIVHLCLPAFTSRLKGIQEANIEMNTDRRLRDCLYRASTTAYRLDVSSLFIGKRGVSPDHSSPPP